MRDPRLLLRQSRSIPQLQTKRQRHAWVRARLRYLGPRVPIGTACPKIAPRFAHQAHLPHGTELPLAPGVAARLRAAARTRGAR